MPVQHCLAAEKKKQYAVAPNIVLVLAAFESIFSQANEMVLPQNTLL